MSSVLIKPIITEKLTSLNEKYNRVGFVVEKTANKVEIAKAIEEMYKVDVESVNTMNYGGGKANVKYTNKGVAHQRVTAYKKAIVTLAKGDSIDFFSGI